jgi:Ca2+-binding RTX toxin-like protein
LHDGGFVAVYNSAGDIRGQQFDALGARVGGEFIVDSSTAGTQAVASVAVLGDGRFVVTWDDGGTGHSDDPSPNAIRQQIFDPRDGVVTGTANADDLYGHNLGSDDIKGLGGDDTLRGLGGDDALYGGDGGDTLIGGTGADLLFGGFGDDTYKVEDAADQVGEAAGAGIDLVQASVSIALAANVENLTLLAGAANGTGNALANTITGNAAANLLDGRAGADNMLGLSGSDTYVVDNLGDVVNEIGGGGIDTVLSSVNFSLVPAVQVTGNVENLTLTGAAAINGIGNALANVLIGNAAANTLNGNAGNDTIAGGLGNDIILGSVGNDRLAGGLGNDRLTGGAGFDNFVFDTKPGALNRDVVVDFNHLQDTFLVDNAVFTKLGGNGALKAGFFHLGAAAADADDHIIYNKTTGALIYDANGNAAGGAVQFATLINKPALQANDFVVI